MFKDLDVFGWAYWKWDIKEDKVANFNLITVVEVDGIIQPTKYFEQLKNAISTVYGSSNIIT